MRMRGSYLLYLVVKIAYPKSNLHKIIKHMSKEYIQIAFDFSNQNQYELLVAELVELGFEAAEGCCHNPG